MIKGHRVEKKIKIKDFLEIVKNIKEENIIVTKHTFFRLSEKQRKIFQERIIKELILKEEPMFAGVQYNKNYSVFYKYGKDIYNIILDIQTNKIKIVTFYIVDGIPKIK